MEFFISPIATIWRQVTKSFTRMILIYTFIFGPHFSQACTVFTFQLGQDNIIMAKNFDWKDGKGTLMYSPRSVYRESIETSQEQGETKKLSWTSQWSSFSFHLDDTGKEWTAGDTIAQSSFPMGGMNEKGLTVEVVWLVNTKYPESLDKSNKLNQLELVRYLLDNAKDTTDVENTLNKVNVVDRFSKDALLHYMACDLEKCIVFEFIDHQLVMFKSDAALEKNKLKNNILTNIFYKKASDDLSPDEFYKGSRRVSPSARFAITRSALESLATPASSEDAFKILSKVFVPNIPMQTQWSYVYEPSKGHLTIPNTMKQKWNLSDYNNESAPIVLESLGSHNNVGSVN